MKAAAVKEQIELSSSAHMGMFGTQRVILSYSDGRSCV